MQPRPATDDLNSIESRFGLRTPSAASATGTSASFDQLLASAVDGAGVTRATEREPGAHGPLRPPAELVAYGNGRIPTDALTSIGGGHRLHAAAAAAYQRLQAAAAADGVHIGITDSYRDYDAQVRLAEEKGLYSQGGLAAAPGTSPHGWGLAVDLDLDGDAQAWMRTHAARFGFVEDVPREPWHWTYRPD